VRRYPASLETSSGLWSKYTTALTGCRRLGIKPHSQGRIVAQRSLFRTLIDSPWWVSVLAAVPTYAVGVLLSRLLPGDANPHVLGVAASLPFLGVAAYTCWLRIRRGPSLDAASLLKALRNASPDDMRAMLAEAYGRARYEIAEGTGGDLELQR